MQGLARGLKPYSQQDHGSCCCTWSCQVCAAVRLTASPTVSANQGRRRQLLQNFWVGRKVVPYSGGPIREICFIQKRFKRGRAQALRCQDAVPQVHAAGQHTVPAGGQKKVSRGVGRRW